MKESLVYSNLERCRCMMAYASPSDIGKIHGGHGDNRGVAETAIAQAKLQCPEHLDNLLYRYVIDAYCGCISDNDSQRLINLSKRIALDLLGGKRGMRKKRATGVARAALHCILKKNLSETERANLIGVSKSNYSERYSDKVNDLLGMYHEILSFADSIVYQQLEY